MKRFISAALIFAGWLAPAAAAAPDDALLAAVRAAPALRLVVDQSYVYTERNKAGKQAIEGYRLPVREIAEDLLAAAGVGVADDAAPTLSVTLEGRAIARLYIDEPTGYLYTGTQIRGDIVVSAPGSAPWRTEFAGDHGPALRLQLNLGFDRPEGAPFPEAFAAATSYIARLTQVVGRIWGVAPLSTALDHADQAVRRHAARTLGDLGDRAAVPALIEALAGADAVVRREAAWALGRLGDRRAVPALGEALSDRDGDVRWFARWALDRLGAPLPLPADATQPATAAQSEPETAVD